MLTEMLCKGLSQIRHSEVMFDFTLKENFRKRKEQEIQGLAELTILIALHYITPTFAGTEIHVFIKKQCKSYQTGPFLCKKSRFNYLKK